jgi:hypothetical protein
VRNLPSLTAVSRFSFVAAMIRADVVTSTVPPNLRIVRFSRTLNSFACRSRGKRPTSSRKRVPSSASSNRPFLSILASVKAPALVTEEFGLDQVLGNRRAVHQDEWRFRRPTLFVDGSGNDFLSRCRSRQSEGRWPMCWPHTSDQLEHPLNGWTIAQDCGMSVGQIRHRGAGVRVRVNYATSALDF